MTINTSRLSNGFYAVAIGDQFLPGLYDTENTAVLATRLGDDTLYLLAKNVCWSRRVLHPITAEHLFIQAPALRDGVSLRYNDEPEFEEVE